MEKTRLVFLLCVMAVFGTTGARGQSKKEKIEILTRQVDSLQRTLAGKSENLVALQVKLARIEGATDAHNEEIKRLETKLDSLKDLVGSRKAVIELQSAKIMQLTTDNTALQTRQKELTGENQELTRELAGLKQKSTDITATAKDISPTDVVLKDARPSEAAKETKAGIDAQPSKSDPLKNRPF